MINKGDIVIYLDDILIATKDLKRHLEKKKNGLRLNMAKCQFAFSKIEYLGYSVTSKGIWLSDAHTKNIREYPLPTNAKEVMSCLGLFQYFRRFLANFSRIAKPLQTLVHQEGAFIMTAETKAAFEELKMLLTSPVLVIYNPKRITELHTDASSSGFGSVLLQRQDDGKFHPVAYYSRMTTPAESKYHSFELETLAIIYALDKFRVYLEGIPFKIVTDCNSLTQALDKKDVNPRIARWTLKLENYNYTIQHRSGVSMGHVDALSRCRQIAAVSDVNDVDFRGSKPGPRS